jgi:hypothetical protein
MLSPTRRLSRKDVAVPEPRGEALSTASFFWSHAGRAKELIPKRSAEPRDI